MFYRFFLNKFFLSILCFIFVVSCDVTKNHDGSDSHSLSSYDLNRNNHNKQNYLFKDLKNNNIVLFPFNKYCIDSKFYNVLDMHASFLHSHPHCKIIIEGHTDNRGTVKYNFILGKNRANSLKEYLLSKGAYVEQISVISYGKNKPFANGHTELDYAKNRRAVIIYKK